MAYKDPKEIDKRAKTGRLAKFLSRRGLPPENKENLIQNRQTYQAELEAENAELRSSQQKIEEARSK